MQCPKCHNLYSITAEELENSSGTLTCKVCATAFDAAIHRNNKQSKFWGSGVACLLLLAIFQIYYFEAYNLSQNTTLRPWLKKICSTTPACQFPDYKNLDKFSILNGSFEPENNHYIFKTTFINQSPFAQKRPSIKLTLLDFTGRSFAERIFHPENYSKMPNTLLEPYLSDETSLSIAAPSNKIGGYRFKLI